MTVQSQLMIAAMALAPLSMSMADTVDVFVDSNFSPSDVVISAGDTVRWVWVSGLHSTNSGDPITCLSDGGWNGTLTDHPAHLDFEVTFETPGFYPYICAFHCLEGQTGTITVQPASATESASWSRVKQLYR